MHSNFSVLISKKKECLTPCLCVESQFSGSAARAGSTFRRFIMKLTGQQYQQLTDALLDAFPSPAKLAEMVRFRLEKNIYTLALGDNLKEIVFKLIGSAEAEGW